MNLRKSLLACLLCVCFAPCARAQADPTPEQIEFFEKKIRPVLAEHCYRCHSADAKKLKGKLLLDSQAGLMKGGEGGVIVVKGNPNKSRLLEALSYTNVDLQMPPRAKLPDAVIADFADWVKMGAPWGKDVVAKEAGDKNKFDLAKRKQEHWSWKPITPHKAPAVKNQAWPNCDVDAFILAKLEDKGLAPAAAADPRTLMRRLYFDVIGLPPTPQEIDAFLQDNGGDQVVNQKAVEKLVDRLLDAPQFGERWGRHWLDLVRYAESRGHEFDYNLPNAYQYRDYVIRALNQDVPYNQFVTEHLAGDLMAKPRLHPTEKFNESILGTGFWFLGEQVHSPVDICQDRTDRHDNMIDVMSKTFLGLTVACARCHDHKFDAISTKDYYSLAGFLQSSSYRLARFDSLDHNREVAEKLDKIRRRTRMSVFITIAQELIPEVENLSEYLLGAREVLTKSQTKEAVARQRKLKADLLDRWVNYLPRAAKDVHDPFHPWAKAALDATVGDGKQAGKLLTPLAQDWRKQLAESKRRLAGTDVVIDYGSSEPKDWLQDGWIFGMRPTKRGEVRYGKDSARPILEIVERGAAQSDSAWDGLKPAPGSENESGSLDRMMRAGRTIRTPAFQVKSGRVHFLVKGTGLAYANVEGHVMIAGPLHGQVVLPIKTGPGYQWVSQDLSRYKGLRAHMEFTSGADLAVAMVVQGDNPPPDGPNEAVLELIEGADVTLASLAGSYQKMMMMALGDMACGYPTPLFPDSQRLANWLLQHADLFVDLKAFANNLDKVTGPILAEQAKLAASIKTASRLAPAMLDGSGVDEHVFIRGSYKTPGEVAPRRLLQALASHEPAAQARDGSGRLHLAEQMTDPAVTPFVPRVMVNRVWHHLFGRGIVASVDNFGVLGEAPTHPELLDYLADQFVKDGWSTKRLIRRLVLSRTYQMSTRQGDKAKQLDAGNLLLSHMRIRRLEGEAIRDAMLQVSGTLDRKMYGPSVPVHLTAFLEGRGRPASGPLDGNGRRSIYLAVRRNFLSPLLLAFDTPSPFSTVGRRTVSNVPAQALILLNDPFVHQQAGKWASRVLTQEKTTNGRITTMYLSALGRPPSAAELAACTEFLEQQGRLGQSTEAALWTDLAHVLFNAKEFIYLN